MKKIIASILISGFILCFSHPATAGARNKPYAKVLVYSMAVDALGKIGGLKAKECLLEALKSREFFVRAYASRAFGRIGDKSVIPSLKRLVNDRHYLVRIMAVKSLIKLGDADAEKTLEGFLYDKNEAVRATAVSGLLEEFGTKFSLLLLQMLPGEKDPVVRSKIIEQLNDASLPVTGVGEKTKPGIDPRLKAIRQALNDKSWQTRQAACYGIAVFKDRNSVPLLMKRLKDENVYVRVAAKIALSELGERSRSLSKLFWQDVEDKNPILRVSSFIALANLKDTKLIPVLLKEVVEPNSSLHVRKGAARALMMLKGPVYEIVGSDFSKSRRYGALSLNNLMIGYKINGKALDSIFVAALQDAASPLHNDSMFVLGELKEELTYPYLRRSLFDKNPDIVANTAFVLGELGDGKALDGLIKICKDYQH